MIAIFGSEDVEQVVYVKDALAKHGYDAPIIDFSSGLSLNFQIDNRNEIYFDYHGVSFCQSSVIWRCTKFLYRRFGDTEEWADEYIKQFFRKESYLNFVSLFSSYMHNDPKLDFLANRKSLQLFNARKCGFVIPRTIVSNSLRDIHNWMQDENSFITKAIGEPYIPIVKSGGVIQDFIMTSPVDLEYLQDNLEKNIEPFPVLIQERVNKKYEYRCVYVNGEFFSFRIDPFQHPVMHIDYRAGGMMVDYIPCKLPQQVEEKIRSYSEMVGLFSGCYDLIEDVNGQFVFLEVNPEGIWGLHDEIMDGNISKAFARQLIKLQSSL